MTRPAARTTTLALILAGLLTITACQGVDDAPQSPATPLPTEAAPTPTVSPVADPDAGVGVDKEETLDANADVEFVRAVEAADGTWTFHVTVHHPDTGWEDYADGWDVLTPDGAVIKANTDSPFTRLLAHPHEDEQPFTRSQGNLAIPEGVDRVRVRAHDIVDGYGGREILVDLTVASGPGFEVVRASQ